MSQGRYVVVRRTDGRAVAADYRQRAQRTGDPNLAALADQYENAGTREAVVATKPTKEEAMEDANARTSVAQPGVTYYARPA